MTDLPNPRRAALGLGLAGIAAVAANSAMAQAPASTWERIKSTGELRIGVTQGEPWFFKDLTSGEWGGIGHAAGKQIAADLGAKLVTVETTWGNAVAALQAGQFDVMFVLDATPQRALAVDFPAQPFFYYAQGVLVRDGIAVRRWSDLDKPDITIGVTLGTAPDRDLTGRMKQAKIERFTTNDQSVLAFQSGKVHAISLYHPALVMQRKRVNQGKVIIPEPARAATTSAGVRREADKTFRDWLGLALDFYYVTGATQTWYETFLTSRGIDPTEAPAVMKELWGRS